MKLHLSTILPCAPARAWQEVQQIGLFEYVAFPLKFIPLNPPHWPEQWRAGKYLVALKLFGWLPLGTQLMDISILSHQPPRYQLRDNGGGQLITRWDHRITIEAIASQQTLYSDTIEIEAGALTLLIWLSAHLFFRWRQHRWRRLVRNQFS